LDEKTTLNTYHPSFWCAGGCLVIPVVFLGGGGGRFSFRPFFLGRGEGASGGNWSRFWQEGVLYTIVSTRAALAHVPRIIKLFIFLKIFIFEKKNVSEYFKRFYNFLHFFFFWRKIKNLKISTFLNII
jgi:hypothetical protein